MSVTPELDALRLELAAECLGSVAKQFAHFAKFGGSEGITDEDEARFGTASEVIGWVAEEYRRCAIKIRATDEMVAAPYLDQPAVPNDASAFEASMSRPPPPALPDQPACIGAGLLDHARERIAEARDALSHGTAQTLRAATQTAALLHTWCGG
jgi:hypothetical protein